MTDTEWERVRDAVRFQGPKSAEAALRYLHKTYREKAEHYDDLSDNLTARCIGFGLLIAAQILAASREEKPLAQDEAAAA